MEIERKWMVTNWPDEKSFPLTETYQMDQGYISVRPTVRIRREALQGGRTALVLCFKGAGTLSREEIETEIDADLFARLERLIGKPLIKKERRSYRLPDGLTLEVNCVDKGLPTAFWYAEVEYKTEAQALAWDPAAVGLPRKAPSGRGLPRSGWGREPCQCPKLRIQIKLSPSGPSSHRSPSGTSCHLPRTGGVCLAEGGFLDIITKPKRGTVNETQALSPDGAAVAVRAAGGLQKIG